MSVPELIEADRSANPNRSLIALRVTWRAKFAGRQEPDYEGGFASHIHTLTMPTDSAASRRVSRKATNEEDIDARRARGEVCTTIMFMLLTD